MSNKAIKIIEEKHKSYYILLKNELNKNEEDINFEKVNQLKEIISVLQEIYFAILREE